jgi:hypothetical protein
MQLRLVVSAVKTETMPAMPACTSHRRSLWGLPMQPTKGGCCPFFAPFGSVPNHRFRKRKPWVRHRISSPTLE